MKTIHIIDPEARKLDGKVRVMFCERCETDTLHSTPFFGYPFRCRANHGVNSRSLCESCDTYVEFVAKILVSGKGDDTSLCELCASADSEQKHTNIAERRKIAAEAALKPVDVHDPESFARALGASSWHSSRK